jgi:hypothetical protein
MKLGLACTDASVGTDCDWTSVRSLERRSAVTVGDQYYDWKVVKRRELTSHLA